MSNVDKGTTVDSMKQYINSLNVDVFSIFEIRAKIKDTASFRICIDANKTAIFTDGSNWGSNTAIREWVHKPRPQNNVQPDG